MGTGSFYCMCVKITWGESNPVHRFTSVYILKWMVSELKERNFLVLRPALITPLPLFFHISTGTNFKENDMCIATSNL